MKYFKDAAGAVYAYEADGSQDDFIPAHLVAITQAEADVLRAPPPEAWDDAYQRAVALLRTQRAPILSVLDGMQGTAATKGLASLLAGDNASAATHSAWAQQIEALKQTLKDAPTAIDFRACATFDAMRAAGRAYYAQLVASAPEGVRTAFNEVA